MIVVSSLQEFYGVKLVGFAEQLYLKRLDNKSYVHMGFLLDKLALEQCFP
jgi:hypothetical protein